MGHQVSIVTHAFQNAEADLTGPGFRFTLVRARSRPRDHSIDLCRQERKRLTEVMTSQAPDVVHAHWTYEHALAAVASGLPTVVTAHDDPWTIARHNCNAFWLFRAFQAEMFRRRGSKARLTAVSPYLAQKWKNHMRWPRDIVVIPNIAPQDVSQRERRAAPYPAILDISDAGPIKNVWRLLEAFQQLRSELSTAELWLVGGGLDDRGALASKARTAGIATRVSFLGPQSREQIASLLSRAWLMVHPSLEETFGVSLAEAMAAKVPVVGGMASGAVPWLLDEGAAGRLVDVTSPDNLTAAMSELIRNSALRGRFSANAAARASSLFSPVVVAGAYLDEYRAALANS